MRINPTKFILYPYLICPTNFQVVEKDRYHRYRRLIFLTDEHLDAGGASEGVLT